MQGSFKAVTGLFLSLVVSYSIWAVDVIVYTESFPPYNYADENGQILGAATANVRQVLQASGLSYEIKLVPWPRAMRHTKADPNALIYTIARTPERELEFDWLVPIGQAEFYLFVRADEDRELTPTSLLAGIFTGVCLNQDASCESLRRVGIPEKNIFPMPNQGYPMINMVVGRRADVYVNDLIFNQYRLKQAGVSPDAVRPVMLVETGGSFYLAAGIQADPLIRESVRKAYARLVKAGSYQMVQVAPPERN